MTDTQIMNHGPRAYNNGCRCDACKKSLRDRMRMYRWRKRLRMLKAGVQLRKLRVPVAEREIVIDNYLQALAERRAAL